MAAAAALAMGAAYVVTGSVNQACVEAGTSAAVRSMLAQARAVRRRDGPRGRHVRDGRQGAGAQARHDVCHAGRQALRAVSGAHASTRSPTANGNIEKTIFRARSKRSGSRRKPIFRSATRRRSSGRPRSEAEDGAVFRWYLGMSSRWANTGEPVANRRLPDLVRAGHGRVQRLGARLLSRAARKPPRGGRRPQHPLWRRRLDPTRIASVQGVSLPAGVPRLTTAGHSPRLRTGCSYPNIPRSSPRFAARETRGPRWSLTTFERVET